MAKSKDPAQIARGPEVSGIPRYFGKGKHKVQLAYITDPEAGILKALDIHGSNPPHTGPSIKNIPNYNDFGSDGAGGTTGGGGGDRRGGGIGGDGGGSSSSSSSSSSSTGPNIGDITGGYNTPTGDPPSPENPDRATGGGSVEEVQASTISAAQQEANTQAALEKEAKAKEKADFEKAKQDKLDYDARVAALDKKLLGTGELEGYGFRRAAEIYDSLIDGGFSISDIADIEADTYKGLLGDMKTDLSLDGTKLGSLSSIKQGGFYDTFGFPSITSGLGYLLGADVGLNNTFRLEQDAQGNQLDQSGNIQRDNQGPKGPTATQPYVTGTGTDGTGGNLGKNIKKLPADPYNLTYNNSYPAMYNPTGFDNSGYMDYLQNIGAPTNENQSLADLYTAPEQVQNPVPPPFFGPMPTPMPFPVYPFPGGPFVPYQNAANGGRIGYDHGGMTGFVDEPISIMYMGNEDEVANTGISGILEKYRQIRSTL